MNRQLHRRAGCRVMTSVTAAAALGLAAAACSSSNSPNSSSSGKVTISVNCEPPATAVAQHKEWIEDVAAFEKANPNITIKSVTYTGQCEVPAQFTATLKAGTETNLFYAYFTDLHQVLDAGQAADITSYVNKSTVPTLGDIVPSAMAAETAGKTLYGLPTSNYTQGLIINRKLFAQAGLDPNKPPTTWAEVQADAKQIAAKTGQTGYAEMAKNDNTGGWILTTLVYALGGRMEVG